LKVVVKRYLPFDQVSLVLGFNFFFAYIKLLKGCVLLKIDKAGQ
jgi:hypothetical protein